MMKWWWTVCVPLSVSFDARENIWWHRSIAVFCCSRKYVQWSTFSCNVTVSNSNLNVSVSVSFCRSFICNNHSIQRIGPNWIANAFHVIVERNVNWFKISENGKESKKMAGRGTGKRRGRPPKTPQLDRQAAKFQYHLMKKPKYLQSDSQLSTPSASRASSPQGSDISSSRGRSVPRPSTSRRGGARGGVRGRKRGGGNQATKANTSYSKKSSKFLSHFIIFSRSELR